MNATGFYDGLSAHYDRFVDWPSRLAFEMPFLQSTLAQFQAHSVMDSACGTGQHVLALAKLGIEASGSDISEQMIARAQENADRMGAQVSFYVAGFGQLAQRVAIKYDAILCLGNSLPHLLSENALRDALEDWHASLAANGILILQMRNLERVLKERQRFMPPQIMADEQGEWVFERFYDWLLNSLIRFNMLRWRRPPGQGWQLEEAATDLRAWIHQELETHLENMGLPIVQTYGDLAGTKYVSDSSNDVVIVARKS